MEFSFNRHRLMTPPNVMDGMEDQMSAVERFPSGLASDNRRAGAPQGGAAGPRAASLSAILAKAEAALPEPTPAQRELLKKLDEARRRIAEGRLRVAALGQFKRGKSTLLNALMGTALLPTGVTPITAIPTFIEGGKTPRLRIEREAPKERLEFRDDPFGALVNHRCVAQRYAAREFTTGLRCWSDILRQARVSHRGLSLGRTADPSPGETE